MRRTLRERGRLLRAAAAALGFALASAATARAQSFDEDLRDAPKITVTVLSPSSEKDFDFALTLIAQGRYAEALSKLRPYTTKYRDRAIPVEVREGGAVRRGKETATWYGVGHYLSKFVLELRPDVRAELDRVDGPAARAQLAAALEARDVDGLLRLAAELPWTRAAADALVGAAALSRERGALEESLALYRRAAERPEYASDPNVAAAVVFLSRSLGERNVPARTGSETADVEGRSVAVHSLTTSPLPAVPKGPLRSGFATPNLALPLDPGPISGGARAEAMLRGEVPLPIEPRPILPVAAGDSVYITNGWTLSAFELATGRPKKGWPESVLATGMAGVPRAERESYVKGEEKWMPLAPAVGGDVVVAPLIVPLKLFEEFVYATYNQIKVRTVIPFRKLHAFDAKTGALLWSHWRPEVAKRQAEFLDQYRCASSPTVHGSRVLAPLYRVVDGATVEFHLTAFDLKTGKIVWDTEILTGSRPINMFGQSLEEFYCCPVSVDGDRVYVSTDLGGTACVDALTGQLLWIHRYDSIPFPRADYHSNVSRPVYWTASPPAFSDEVVVFSPTDSLLLLAVDKRTGRRVNRFALDKFSLDRDDGEPIFASKPRYVRHNLGIVDNVLYVVGEQVYAIDVPSVQSPVFRKRDASSASRYLLTGARPARPALTDKSILIPVAERGIAVLDRNDLRLVHTIPYDVKGIASYAGNLAVSDGIVVSVANPRVAWFFDTDALVETARRAVDENPEDVQLRDRLAEALRLRGANHFADRNFDEAVDSYREAERVLQTAGNRGAAAAKIHLALAEALAARGDVKDSIHAFRRAFEGAGDGDTRLKAAVGLERALPRDAAAERAKILALLEREYGAERIQDEGAYGDVLVGLYTCLRRADAEHVLDTGDGTRPGDPAAAVAAWQEILQRYPDETFGATRAQAAPFARARIAEALRRFGRECYRTVEEAAARQLEALGPNPSPSDLTQLIRTYPNSQVALNASCLRVEQLAKTSYAIDVPMAVFEFLQNDPPADMRARALRASASVLRQLGNDSAAAGLEARAGGVLTLEPAPVRAAAGPSTPVTSEVFDEATRILRWIRLDADDGSAPESVFAVEAANLAAYRSVAGSLSKRRWKVSLPREVVPSETGTDAVIRFPYLTVHRGVLTIAHGDYLIGVKADSGQSVFTYQLDGEVEGAASSGGVIVLSLRGADAAAPGQLVAYDATGGALLWQASLEPRGGPYLVAASATDAVALGLGAREPRAIARFDVLTGDVKPPVPSNAALDRLLTDLASWARPSESKGRERSSQAPAPREISFVDRLREARDWFALYDDVLVWFARDKSDVHLSKLAGLRLPTRTDRVGEDSPWELAASRNPKTRLSHVLFTPREIVVLRQRGDGTRTDAGRTLTEVLLVAPASGEATVVATVPHGAQLAGAVDWDRARRWLASGLVTYTTESGAASTRFDFVDFSGRRSWMRSIPARVSDVASPAIGRTIVGIAYSLTPSKGAGSAAAQHEVRFLRRESGEYAAEMAYPLIDGKPLGFAVTDSSFLLLSGYPLERVNLRRFFSSESNR